MALFRCRKTLCPHIIKSTSRCFATAPQNDEEYTATPQYPPILDTSYEKRLERKKESVHEEIKNVKTIEEKQIKLNMPKYYGFKTYMLTEDYIPYNNLGLVQHVTRTHLIENNTLPEGIKEIKVNAEDIREDVEEAILIELEGYKKLHDLRNDALEKVALENFTGSSISHQLNRIIINSLCRDHEHLKDIQVDANPRIESCWYAGGMVPPSNVKKYRENQSWQKDKMDEPTNRAMCYLGAPYLTVRSSQPLAPLLSVEEAENPALEVPYFKYDPRTVGTKTEHRRIVNVPGYWPGDSHRFGIISYLRRGHLSNRHYNILEDHKEAIHRQGILHSFAYLNAQANMLGFTTFNDITYPLVTQSIITNGQMYSFYTYQLNTLLIHGKNTSENPKRNVCWATPEMKLYEEVNSNKLVGFNSEVLENLLKFYLNVPKERLGINLTPFVSQHEKIAADYEDEEKRVWIENEYKAITSNRPRQHLQDETYQWEKIYKIDFNTRFMEAKRRPFELRYKVSDRTYDDRKPRYIPRALRPHLPKHKGRDAKEFFP